jgi:archaellin
MKKLILVAACVSYSIGVSAQNATYANSSSDEKNVLTLNENNSSGNSNNAYHEYINKVKQEIIENDKNIDQLKSSVRNERKDVFKKHEKKLNALSVENSELKTDLHNYISYGIGDWKIFKKEFNQDLLALRLDLTELGKAFVNENLMAANSR